MKKTKKIILGLSTISSLPLIFVACKCRNTKNNDEPTPNPDPGSNPTPKPNPGSKADFSKADVNFELINGLSLDNVTVSQVSKDKIIGTDKSSNKFNVNIINIKPIDESSIEITYNLSKDKETSQNLTKKLTGFKIDFSNIKVQIFLKDGSLFSSKKPEEITKDSLTAEPNNKKATAEILDVKIIGKTSIIVKYQITMNNVKSKELFKKINALQESQNIFSNANVEFTMKNGKMFNETIAAKVKPEDLKAIDKSTNKFEVSITSVNLYKNDSIIVEYELTNKTDGSKSGSLYKELTNFEALINWNEYEIKADIDSNVNATGKNTILPSEVKPNDLIFKFINKITNEQNTFYIVDGSLSLTHDDDKGIIKVEVKFTNQIHSQTSEAYNFAIEGLASTKTKEISQIIYDAHPYLNLKNGIDPFSKFLDEFTIDDFEVKVDPSTNKELKYEIVSITPKKVNTHSGQISSKVKFSYKDQTLVTDVKCFNDFKIKQTTDDSDKTYTSSDGNNYTINKNGKIIKIEFKGDKKHLVFPEEAKEISDSIRTKFNNSEVETVDLKNVEVIQSGAFELQTNLKEVLGKKVKNLGYSAFDSTTSLEKFEISDKPETIVKDCFRKSKLVKKVINGNLEYSIFNKNILIDVTGSGTNLELDDSITIIANSALEKIRTISGFKAKNLKVICDENFSGKQSQDVKFTIEDLDLSNVEYLGRECFRYNNGLKKLKLNGITSVYNVISNNSDLEEVEMNNITKIENSNTFSLCPKLKKITTPKLTKYSGDSLKDTPLYKTNSSDFFILGELLVGYKGTDENVVIPENVKMISIHGFYRNKSLKTIDLKNVEGIEYETFAECTNLEKITAMHLSYVGNYAFRQCNKITRFIYDANIKFKYQPMNGSKYEAFSQSSIADLID